MNDFQANRIKWTAHPARERPGRAAMGIAVIALLSAAVWLSFGWEWSVASAVILLLSLNRFFLPSRFELDDERIMARYPLQKKILHWRDVRRFVHDSDGGFLSTRSRRSLLDPSSGMHVLFGGDAAQRERIIECIQKRVKHDAHDAERRATSQPHPIATGADACRD